MHASWRVTDAEYTHGWRRSLSLLIAAILVAVAVIPLAPPAPAAAAPGDPFDPAVPRVLIAQDVPTRLYSAVQGDGAIAFQAEGAVSAVGYNAVGFRTGDNYLYGIRRDAGSRTVLVRIGQGGVVTSLGAVAGLADPGVEVYNQGAFGAGATANILYVRTSQASSTQLWAVNVVTRAATLITLSAAVPNVSDLVWKDGYLWGLHSDDRMYRINPSTGQVSSWASGLGLNRAFGAQWVYGNGNLGLSDNGLGTVHQVSISDPTGANPVFTRVSATAGPASANNDGASIPGLPVDLGIVKTGPAVYTAGGAITYSLVVTNNGPGVSSGYQVRDALPAGITGASSSTAGCAVASGVLQCALSGLAVGASRTITVTGTVAAATTGLLSNTAVVTGNESDPNPANDRSTTVAAFSAGFRCTADVVYGLNTSGAVLAINRATGASAQEGYFPAGASALMNSLAITADGRYAYAASQSGTKTVYRYDTTTGTATTLGTVTQPVSHNLFMGAINPVDGLYYLGGIIGSQYVFYAFDTTTNTSLGERFRVTAPPTGGNGDLAFDSEGRAFIVMSGGGGVAANNQLVVVDVLPTNGSLASSRLLTYPGPSTAQFQGIAFGSDGYLYAQYTAATRVLVRIDPNSGAAVSSTTIRNPDGTNNTVVSDLSSCTLNSTLTLRKNVQGRYASGDQFTVTITGNGVATGNTGTTFGSTTGLQTAAAATAGAIVGVPGRTYTITETPSGGASLSNYLTLWECTDADGALVASGTGTSGSVTIPLGSNLGAHIECVFTNEPIPSWTIAKQALRGAQPLTDGAVVHPGETITYRVTATNTSAAALTAATLRDDLTQVLDDATFVAGSAQLVVAGGAPIAVPDPAGAILGTPPFTLPGGAVATLTYRVVVDGDAWSATLRNAVTGTAGKPGQPIVPQCPTTCTTTQLTPSPVQVQKVGEAGTGAVVPMDGSAWSIWSAASGGTAVVASMPAATAGGSPVVGLFRDVTLTAGTYWLEETRSLDGFALLAQRVPFTVATDGTVALGAGAPATVSIVEIDGVRTIRVEDVPALALPDAGGPGTGGIHGLGLGLVLSGIAAASLLAVRRRRLQGAESGRWP